MAETEVRQILVEARSEHIQAIFSILGDFATTHGIKITLDPFDFISERHNPTINRSQFDGRYISWVPVAEDPGNVVGLVQQRHLQKFAEEFDQDKGLATKLFSHLRRFAQTEHPVASFLDFSQTESPFGSVFSLHGIKVTTPTDFADFIDCIIHLDGSTGIGDKTVELLTRFNETLHAPHPVVAD